MHKRPKVHSKAKTLLATEKLPTVERPTWKISTTIALLVIVASSLGLNLTAINWGQPGGNPWHPDSIAGAKILYQWPNLFGQWKHKYPRVHFLVSAAFYKPFLSYWKEHPVMVSANTGQQVRAEVLTQERISTLVVISGLISAIMGAAAVVAVFLTARLLFNDDVAALFSGLALAFSMLFVFFSHLGNLDIPCTFWFAWSVYWAIKAAYIGKWRHFLLLGLFCALTVCTKDPAAGYITGLAAATALAMIGMAKKAGKSFKTALASIFTMKPLVAVLVAAFCFALLNDLLTTPRAFFERMNFWFEVGVAEYNKAIIGYWPVLSATGDAMYYSLGWPLLAVIIASAIYCILRFRWKSAFALLPLIVFYVVVILRTRLGISRYFIPGFVGLMLLVGKGCSDWLRWRSIPLIVRILPLAFVYIFSLLYCVGLDLEMLDDSRYGAEQWLVAHVSPGDTVAALSQPAYAPRVQLLGCKYDFITERPKNDELLQKIRPYTDYLVLTEAEFSMPVVFDQQFLKELLAGTKGYEQVACFSNKYLYPKKTVFGFAGWPLKHSTEISPGIIILKKQR
jgi:hypothetical protein